MCVLAHIKCMCDASAPPLPFSRPAHTDTASERGRPNHITRALSLLFALRRPTDHEVRLASESPR
eukprot:14290248-Alexandrium_andersonii.AAC.1